MSLVSTATCHTFDLDMTFDLELDLTSNQCKRQLTVISKPDSVL